MSGQIETLLRGNSLVSFGASVSADLRADVMDCLQYAQLSADKKYHRSRQWREWIEQYQRVIYQNGARITGAIHPLRLEIRGVRDLRYLSARLRGEASSPELRQLLEQSIEQLMQSDHADAFFNSWFSSGQSETMQVIPCEADGHGGVTVLVCGLQMTTRALASSGFWWSLISGVMLLQANGASFLMTHDSYSPYRESIAGFLANQATQEIIDL